MLRPPPDDGLPDIYRLGGGILKAGGVSIIRDGFIKWFPHLFVTCAHLGGIALSIWMRRWDLLAAGIAFGLPSTLLFVDLLPGGPNYTVKLVKKLAFRK